MVSNPSQQHPHPHATISSAKQQRLLIKNILKIKNLRDISLAGPILFGYESQKVVLALIIQLQLNLQRKCQRSKCQRKLYQRKLCQQQR